MAFSTKAAPWAARTRLGAPVATPLDIVKFYRGSSSAWWALHSLIMGTTPERVALRALLAEAMDTNSETTMACTAADAADIEEAWARLTESEREGYGMTLVEV